MDIGVNGESIQCITTRDKQPLYHTPDQPIPKKYGIHTTPGVSPDGSMSWVEHRESIAAAVVPFMPATGFSFIMVLICPKRYPVITNT